jgi:hypothetical protein
MQQSLGAQENRCSAQDVGLGSSHITLCVEVRGNAREKLSTMEGSDMLLVDVKYLELRCAF